MRKILYSWRYYKLGRTQYYECMGKVFINNLLNLRQASTIVAVFLGCFSLFPILVKKNIREAGIYLAVAVVALLLSLFVNYIMQKTDINNPLIYALTTVFYINIIVFGIYLNVWSNPDKLASLYLCFLICALMMFINSPLYNLALTAGAMIAFMASTVLVKSPEDAIFDIVNALIAGVISLYFNWYLTKMRLELEFCASMLEEERNNYYDQSIVDELTKLRNRRDFMQTFQRYLSNYRSSDDWLCIAIADIDFFKNYNDHYGHPMGDDCLRSMGRVLGGLKDSMSVYAARVGGEEFALLWFEQDISHVDVVISHITKSINSLKIPHEKSRVCEYVTMSIGVYIEQCGASNEVDVLYDLADKALYTAKGNGRNCAIISGREITQYQINPA